MSYGATTHNSGILHLIEGDLSELDSQAWHPTRTLCNRIVTPVNYFTSLADYRQSYNRNGTLCKACEKASI